MKRNLLFGDALPIDMDTLISGAILIDVGKLLTYAIVDGKLAQIKQGDLVNHTFSGVALAHRFDLPAEVIHLIAVHSREGDLDSRTTEGWISTTLTSWLSSHSDRCGRPEVFFALLMRCSQVLYFRLSRKRRYL